MSTYKPTEAMASAAKKALKIRDEQPDSNKGMTQVGLTRARQLISRESLSLDTVKRMHSFFSRHEVDKKGKGWGVDSKGYQAWLGWGGDAGQSWAKSIVEREAKADNVSVNEFIGDCIDEIEVNAEASKSIMESLRKKAKEHNDSAKYKVTADKLYKIFKRGVGAYSTNPQSVKPGVSGSTEWGHRRVSAWLRALESGRFKSGAFDTDLLPEGHPLKKAKNEIQANVIKYEDGKYFVYSEEGKKLSKGYDSKSQAEKRLGQIEYFKSMNQIIINTNAKKSDMSEDAEYFYLKSIPITVNNSVMNEVLYTREENQKGMPSMIGRPLTIGHPVDESGNFISGQNGDGLQKHYSGGIITNTYEVANTWYADAKIEKKVLDVKSPELYESISNKDDLPVSTGLLFAQNEMKGFNDKGEEYKKVAINMQFDHLAALLDEAPAGGDDTVAKFNSLEVPVFHVNELIEQQIPSEVKEEVETLLSKASNGVKSFFSTLLHKPITNGYNKQDKHINVNEADIVNIDQLVEAIKSNPEVASAVNEMMDKKAKKNMSYKDMKNMDKDKAMEMMKNMSPEDAYSFFKNMEDDMEKMKKNMGSYKTNQSDNPELLNAINSLREEVTTLKAEKNAGVIDALAANSACGFDKDELKAMPETAINKLAAQHLGSVGFNPVGGFDAAANSGKHELDDMGAPE